MAPPPRPKNCAPSWRNPSPSGSSPTPSCSCWKSREPAWVNSRKLPCASNSPTTTGSPSRELAPVEQVAQDEVYKTSSPLQLFSQQSFPAGPGVGACFLVGLAAVGVLAGAHETVSRAIVSDRVVSLACGFHLLDGSRHGRADARIVAGVK